MRSQPTREQRAGFAEIEAGDVTLLVIWLGRNAQQFGGGVVAGKGAHARGVLARHQRVIAVIVACGASGIAGGEDAWYRRHAQIAVDQQPAEIVALGRNLLGQRRGANAGCPDHGLGFDVFAVWKA